MRPDNPDKFAGGDDFGFLPKLWEVALIAGNQIVRASGVGTFEENTIVWVRGDLKQTGGRDEMGPVFEELKKLLPEAFANVKLRARQHGAILCEDGRRQVEAGWPCESQEKYCALQTEGLERGRYNNIGVEDQTEREHLAFTRSVA
jgi:hypothetical protein